MTDQRIASLDVLRGFALLGILLMNIQSFAMPNAAYINPAAFGDLSGINGWVWKLSHFFADQKFMSLFSMLFGAGVLLFSERLESRGERAGKWHYRRMAWLLVFGVIHGYGFWYGDILFCYAWCGMAVFLMRKKSIPTLLVLAFVFTVLGTVTYLFTGISMPYIPAEDIQSIAQSWQPDADAINKEITAMTGSFTEQFAFRAEQTIFMQSYVFLTTLFWRASGMMLLGMALFKSGFFHLRWSNASYVKLAATGLVVGSTLILYGMHRNALEEFDMAYSMFLGSQFNYWGSWPLALAYASLVMLAVKHNVMAGLQRRLTAIGKTAFSNYIMHTLIAMLLFNGFGLFGHTQRWQQLLIVLLIWLFQLWLAPWFTARYKMGPLESLWRRLTYGASR